MKYNVNFYTYSGMRINLASQVDKDEARMIVRHANKRARRARIPVVRQGGLRWEHQEADDNGGVSDLHGTLVVTRVVARRGRR